MDQDNRKQEIATGDALVEVFSFPVEGGVGEHQAVIHATNVRASFTEQLRAVAEAYDALLAALPAGTTTVFKRYFLSDAANQSETLLAQEVEGSDGALSLVGQPPLDGSKVALYAYLQEGMATRTLQGGLFEASHGAYRHLWGAGAYNRAANAEYQTRLLLNDYVMQLTAQGARLATHCVRTWFFVRDVDVNYAGMVKARNEVFLTQGLTPETHFIASTGIGGLHSDPAVKVQMDSYAVTGLCERQVRFLYAAAYLNRTSDYGVSFERGTCVDYGDRRHVFLSGTASIDNRGEVVCPGDIRRQTERMWTNVEALLEEAECTAADVAQMTVYLRDPADYTVVSEMYAERFPGTPRVIVLAPVCRPGWLIEMECMALKHRVNPDFPAL